MEFSLLLPVELGLGSKIDRSNGSKVVELLEWLVKWAGEIVMIVMGVG